MSGVSNLFGVLWLTGGWFVRAVLQQVADSGRRPGTGTNPLKVLVQHTAGMEKPKTHPRLEDAGMSFTFEERLKKR